MGVDGLKKTMFVGPGAAEVLESHCAVRSGRRGGDQAFDRVTLVRRRKLYLHQAVVAYLRV